jgi:hypothetical protein
MTTTTKTFKSDRYPLVAAWANDEIDPTTRAGQDVKLMLRNGHPVLDIFTALEKAASFHANAFERSIAFDYVSGDDWLQTAVNARRLLDSELGPVEGGLLERFFWHITSYAGFDTHEVEAAM